MNRASGPITATGVWLAFFALAGCRATERAPSANAISPPPVAITVDVRGILPDLRQSRVICADGTELARRVRGTETDPRLLVDPTDPQHWIVSFMADLPSGGLYAAVSRDAGKSWQIELLPMASHCGGAPAAENTFGDQDMAFTRDGRPVIGAITGTTFMRDGKLAIGTYSVSTSVISFTRDGKGEARPWHRNVISSAGNYQHTVALVQGEDELDAFWAVAANGDIPIDVEPHLDANAIYGARSTDGARWSPPRSIASGSQVWGAVKVPRYGTFLHVDDNEFFARSPGRVSWRRLRPTALRNPNLPIYQFEGGSVFAGDRPLAADTEGCLYQIAAPLSAAQQLVLANAMQLVAAGKEIGVPLDFPLAGNMGGNAIFVSRSCDGGASWLEPVVISESRNGAFGAQIAVARNGNLASTWYGVQAASNDILKVQAFASMSTDKGRSWSTAPIGPPFDMSQAPIFFFTHYLGNYQALEPLSDGSFAAAMTIYSPETKSADIRFSIISGHVNH